jgi:hypothetical protein
MSEAEALAQTVADLAVIGLRLGDAEPEPEAVKRSLQRFRRRKIELGWPQVGIGFETVRVGDVVVDPAEGFE